MLRGSKVSHGRATLIALSMATILTGCVGSGSATVRDSAPFCALVPPGGRIYPEDRAEEVGWKLRLFGRVACICDDDCPAAT